MSLKETLQKKKLYFCVFFLCCAIFVGWLFLPQPDYNIWPPVAKNPKHAIYVVVDDEHTYFTLPDYKYGMFQEWHMGSKNWYHNPIRTWKGRLEAAFVPSEGVIRFGIFPFAPWEIQKSDSQKVYKFWLSSAGYLSLKKYLHKFRGSKLYRKNGYWYFKYSRNYHLFANCNGFVSGGLRTAGLPVREVFGIERLTMEYQLKRCLSFQEKHFLAGQNKKRTALQQIVTKAISANASKR